MKNIKKRVSKTTIPWISKVILICIVVVWFALFLVDVFGNIFRQKLGNVFYFRAWEVVSNYDGANSGFTYFKPWITYDGPLDGDLLNPVFLKSKRTENKKQLFISDEYGYRNTPHFLDKQIDAVVIGTSFVGGAALSQNELISTILTNKYGIRTYNYTYSVQGVWDDAKFKKNSPKFLIYLGEDADIISTNWFYTITDKAPPYPSIAWKSYQDWEKATNRKKIFTYEKFSEDLRNFSLLRVGVNDLYRELINFHQDWKTIVGRSIQDVVEYDPGSDMLFFQPSQGNPTLGSIGKTKMDIEKAITVLNESQDKLQTRGIKLVIAPMPSKAYAEMKKYRNLDDSQSALAVYNKQAEEKGKYINVDLLQPSKKYFSDPKFQLYFSDDSHWNGNANEIAARAIALKICQDLPSTHMCHKVLDGIE